MWISNRLLFFGTAAAACTYLAFLAPYWWGFDMLTHFRVHELAALLPALATLIAARRWILGGILLPACLINLALLAPLWLDSPARPAGPARLTVTSFNVNSDNDKREETLAYALGTGADYVVLTEIGHAWKPILFRPQPPYRLVEARPQADNFGIATYSRLPVKSSKVVYYTDYQLATIEAVLDWDGGEVLVLAVHVLPPGGRNYSSKRDQQLAELAERVRKERRPVVLAGDLNATPWSHPFRRLLDRGQLIDSKRGFGYQPTWPAGLGPIGIPIDHCLHTRSLATVTRTTGPSMGSDHHPVTVVMAHATP